MVKGKKKCAFLTVTGESVGYLIPRAENTFIKLVFSPDTPLMVIRVK